MRGLLAAPVALLGLSGLLGKVLNLHVQTRQAQIPVEWKVIHTYETGFNGLIREDMPKSSSLHWHSAFGPVDRRSINEVYEDCLRRHTQGVNA